VTISTDDKTAANFPSHPPTFN